MAMTRKQFLQSAAAVAAVGLFACVGDDRASTTGGSTSSGDGGSSGGEPAGDACGAGGEGGADSGGGADGGDGSSKCLDNGTNAAISNNHGHTLVVSKQDVAAGVEKTYDLLGGATHPHEVTLTAQHFAQLAQDQPITVVSTEEMAHDHTVTVTCA